MQKCKNINIWIKIVVTILVVIISINMFSSCNAADKLNVYAPSYIAYDRITKKVMFGKNIDKQVPMASTTKIMTAILTIEYGKLDEVVTVTKNAEKITGWQLNLKQGDKILLRDLLYAIMLYSANDGAAAIAEHIGGSIEGFCQMMNEKAKQIGAVNTNFTSPHGLDNDMHYSTPYDLAIIMDYALENKIFRDVIGTKNYTISINGYSRTLNNTNKLISTLQGCIGGKTGYTGKAGYCLVSNCKKDNMDVIAVVLGAGTTKQRFDETASILNYAIENYEIVSLNNYLKQSIKINIYKNKQGMIDIIPKQSVDIPILKSDKDKIEVKYEVFDYTVIAPVEQGEVLARATILNGDNELAQIEYITQDNYDKITYIDYMKYILGNYINLLEIRY